MDATDEVIGIMDRKQRDMKARIRELEAELAEALEKSDRRIEEALAGEKRAIEKLVDLRRELVEAQAELAEARRDECRKEFMCQQGCYMWHDIDGESCWLVWPHGRDGEGQMESQTERYATHNVAIDAAMEGK